MKATEYLKLKTKILDEYREKNQNRAKEYEFSLPAEYAAKLDYVLDGDNLSSLQEFVMFYLERLFDHELNRRECMKEDENYGLPSILKKLLGDRWYERD